jgi:Kef-type K+ transport system membrane component KefB
MLYSPALLGGWLGISVGAWAEPLTNAALGIIAYLIGGSVTVAQLRRTGRVILLATLGEALLAAVCVFLAMLVLLPDTLAGVPAVVLALAFGAIAAPTAPAATIAVLHQYHARGPMSATLLGVVALDDAVGIILFALVSIAITATSFASGLGGTAVELFGAVLLGLAVGWFSSRLARHLIKDLRLPLVVAAVLLTLGLAERLGVSQLLAAMTLGFASRAWLGAAGDRMVAPVEYLEELVFLIFFSVAGALFNPGVLTDHVELVAAYFLARAGGKIAGAALGARLGGAPPAVVRWLGFGLVPQAGVAVGLALALSQDPNLHSASEVVINVILGSTLLTAVIGPVAMRLVLVRAGELGARRKRSKHR